MLSDVPAHLCSFRGRIAFLKDVFHAGTDPRFRFRVGEDIKLLCGDGPKDTRGNVRRGHPGLYRAVGGLPHGFLFRTQGPRSR